MPRPSPKNAKPTEAEPRPQAEATVSSDSPESLTPEATTALLYQLSVHQIELEMQNEELRKAQLELEDSRARYFDLYDFAPVGYCTIDEEGKILEANLTLAALLGETRDRLIGQSIFRFIAVEDADMLYLLNRRICRSRSNPEECEHANEPSVCELRLAKPDGSELWVQLVITLAPDSGNTVSRAPVGGSCRSVGMALRVVVNDISERKAAEVGRALLESNQRESLERQINAQTSDLNRDVSVRLKLEEELRQLQKLESIGRLASGVAHDFNNILSSIGLSGDALTGEDLDSNARFEVAREIADAVDRGGSLTRQMLAFARKQPICLESLDLGTIVKNMAHMLRRLVKADIEVTLDVPDGLPAIEGDKGMLEQIVLNLAVNARDAMNEQGKLQFALKLTDVSPKTSIHHPEAAVGRFIRLTVSDTGKL